MKRKAQNQEYTHSPWSGEAYKHPPTVDELTEESTKVIARNPAIARTTRREAMDKFIEAYRAKAGRTDGKAS